MCCAVLQVVVSMAMIRKATDGSRPSVSAKERYVHNFTVQCLTLARSPLAARSPTINSVFFHFLSPFFDVILELGHVTHVWYGVSLVSLRRKQLAVLYERFAAKLPPTDSRLRPD